MLALSCEFIYSQRKLENIAGHGDKKIDATTFRTPVQCSGNCASDVAA